MNFDYSPLIEMVYRGMGELEDYDMMLMSRCVHGGGEGFRMLTDERQS